jgi:DNA ligase (NAD+)
MDGLTCSLHYRGGRLVRAETRGNGKVGEDITHNAYKIPSIPKTIDSTYDTVVDGEIICTYENFEKFSTEYSNPRNFASGSIRLLDSNECAKRGLIFVAWDMINGYDKFNEEDIWPSTLAGKLRALQHLGFEIVPWARENYECNETVEMRMELVKQTAKEKHYPIDGLVFKYNICRDYDLAGRTEHHFKGGLAYKFYDELYETELVDIEWSMGRTGVLTPVAIYKDIDIDGATCNRASLHNVSVMNELLGQPFVGQKLRIFRANQIIPQVYDAEKSPYTVSTLRIKECPICKQELELNNNDGVLTLFCPNENCEGKLLNILDHFCGKKGLDIKGLSKATLEKLMDWGWVNSPADIFELHLWGNEWEKKEGFGVKSVDKILAAIEASRNCELSQFISSLGIPLSGLSVAKDLAKKFDTYESFREAIAAGYDFSQLPNFGYEKTQALLNFNYVTADIISKQLNLTNENSKQTDNKLKGLIFCATGKINLFKNRTELKSFIEKNGGKLTDSVSSKTNYLINNDIESTSSKNKTAKSLGIPIITESQFKELLN